MLVLGFCEKFCKHKHIRDAVHDFTVVLLSLEIVHERIQELSSLLFGSTVSSQILGNIAKSNFQTNQTSTVNIGNRGSVLMRWFIIRISIEDLSDGFLFSGTADSSLRHNRSKQNNKLKRNKLTVERV
jgi:hypothetical protein